MKKIIAFLSAITLLGSTTLTVTACGVSKGSEITINTPNAPKKAKNDENPLTDYVYNDKYNYLSDYVSYLLTVAAQLTTDKIRYDKGATYNTPDWKEFYNSAAWQSGSFSSFNYEQTSLPAGEKDFSFKVNNGEDLIYQVKNNDSSVDDNRLRAYWFVTSKEPWVPDQEKSEYAPTKNNIDIPKLTDFGDQKQIIKNGWIHLYLRISNFKIDFSAKINFSFSKVEDKNHIPLVVLDLDTFAKPFGNINFNDPKPVFDDRINNVSISKVDN